MTYLWENLLATHWKSQNNYFPIPQLFRFLSAWLFFCYFEILAIPFAVWFAVLKSLLFLLLFGLLFWRLSYSFCCLVCCFEIFAFSCCFVCCIEILTASCAAWFAFCVLSTYSIRYTLYTIHYSFFCLVGHLCVDPQDLWVLRISHLVGKANVLCCHALFCASWDAEPSRILFCKQTPLYNNSKNRCKSGRHR